MATFKPYLHLRRGRIWYAVYPGADGRKKHVSTKLRGTEQKRKAEAWLQLFIRRLGQGARVAGEGDEGPMTVTRFSKQWLASREAKGITTVGDYRGRLRLHILPHIGSMRLDAVRPEHITAVVAAMAAKKDLAPRTQRNVYFTMHAMFRRAVPRLIEVNPCSLQEEDLPRKKDADPEWRATAVFSREEVVQLLTAECIPLDRRVFYAVLFLGGLRFGEVSALRRRHYSADMEPLARLQVANSYNSKLALLKGTKTDVPRLVPVHPWLKQILDRWLAGGWAEVAANPGVSVRTGFRPGSWATRGPVPALLAGPPGPDDLLIPTRDATHRNASTTWKQLDDDLKKLGLRPRRQHDARRTMITLLLEDGAAPDILRHITHGKAAGNMMDLYSEIGWPAKCAEIAKLQLRPPPPLPANVRPLWPNGAQPVAPWCPIAPEIDPRQGVAGELGPVPGTSAEVVAIGPRKCAKSHASQVAIRLPWVENLNDSAAIGKRPQRDSKTTPPDGQCESDEVIRGNPAENGGPDDSPDLTGGPSNGPEGPMATMATLVLRQVLAALDRGRLDEAREILQRAIEAEEGGGADHGRGGL